MEHFIKIGEQITMALEDYTGELFERTEIALDDASDYLVSEFGKHAQSSDKKNHVHRLATSFFRTDKYKGVRYCGSTFLNKKGIPVANLLEFAAKGKGGWPFMRATFDNSVPHIAEIFVNKLQ